MPIRPPKFLYSLFHWPRRVPTGRLRQAEVFAKRTAFIFGAEQPPSLQLRHHQIDEIMDASGQRRWHIVETVRRLMRKPVLHHVRDLLRRSHRDIVAVASRDRQIEL